ncbi:MAG TPA: helix-turn-helix transcriptional regulator [bacterium]|mgnify:FL=1|nr:helix-turn-helix transcriptional regulator [bacterium]
MSSTILRKSKKFSYGVRIKEIREEHGLNKTAFANRLHWSRPQVTKYEQDQESPNIEKLIQLNNEFNINLHWLLTGIGDKYFTVPGLFIVKTARPLISDSGREYACPATAAEPLTDDQLNHAYRTMQNIYLKLQAAKHPFKQRIIHLLDAILDLFE